MVSLLENSMTTASLSDVLQYFRFMGDRLRFRDGKEPIEAVFLMKECQGFKYSVIATETEETIFSQISKIIVTQNLKVEFSISCWLTTLKSKLQGCR